MDVELLAITVAADTELRLVGELDLATAPLLDKAVQALRAGATTKVTLDMSGVSFVDSRGLRSMLIAHKSGGIVLRNPSPQVVRLLEITGVDELLPTVDDA